MIGEREVHVWEARTEDIADPARSAACLSLLSITERARHDRFVFERDRQTFRAAHAMLRLLLGTYLDRPPRALDFVTGPWGRPELSGTPPPLRFNLSHTTGFVACAITRTFDCGIDLEYSGRSVDVAAAAAHVFAPEETAGLADLTEEMRLERFLALWTIKESVVKALGRGLAQPLASIVVDLDTPAGDAVRPCAELQPGVWRIWRWPASECHRGAVAVRGPDDGPLSLTRRRWDPVEALALEQTAS